MVKTAIAFLLGCVLCFLSDPALLATMTYIVLSVLLIAVWRRYVFIISLLLGWLIASVQIQTLWQDQLVSESRHRDVVVTGSIASVPETEDKVVRFLFRPETKTLPKLIRLSWYTPPDTVPKADEKWQLSLRLKAPRGLKNPGGFDYEKWLFSQHIGATGYVRKSLDNKRVQTASLYRLNHWREHIMHNLKQHYPDARFMPLILGLTIGYRAEMTDEHWNTLRLTGTTHLLAISGLHIGLAAAVGYFLWRWLWSFSCRLIYLLPAQRAGAVGGFVTALFYALLAGLSIPTQRALIMVSMVMLALWFKRPVFPVHVLALSLLLVLLLDPVSVLHIGFWLSFAAVAVIMLVATRRFPTPRFQWLSVHFWIALGLTPLLIVFFGQTSLISPLANIVAVPVISFIVVPLLLLSICCLVFNTVFTTALLWLADHCLFLLWQLLSWLAQSPVTSWTLAELPLSFWLLSFLATCLLLLPRGFAGKYWGLLILPALLAYQPGRPQENSFTLSVLDVGQGLATVVETHQHTLIYDTGAAYRSGFDMGENVVVPFLQSRGVSRVDKLIISHSDNDHSGGAASVLRLLSVDEIISSDKQTHATAQLCQSGQSWQWDGVDFEFLHPTTIMGLTDNNRSCVLKVTSRDYSVLLTGDIEVEIEKQLIKQAQSALNSDVLIAAHHGSRTSSSDAFIEAVSPDYGVFSAGYRNHYGFPAKEVLARYHQHGIAIWRTDLHGAILFSEQGKPLSWRQQSQRIWSAKATE